jgi:hypothetical protein
MQKKMMTRHFLTKLVKKRLDKKKFRRKNRLHKKIKKMTTKKV